MNNCVKCGMICLAAGMIVGAIAVAKNKKLAAAINDGTNKVKQTFTEVKDDVEDKIQEIKEDMSQKNSQNNSTNKKKN